VGLLAIVAGTRGPPLASADGLGLLAKAEAGGDQPALRAALRMARAAVLGL
jgi:hypothetical protein